MHPVVLVAEFHGTYGHPIALVPTTPSPEMRRLRFRLLFEEVMEFGRAIGIRGLSDVPEDIFERQLKLALDDFTVDPDFEVNLVEAADALGDIDYVKQGADLVFGFPSEAVIREIHASNMSKLGTDGLPIYDEFKKVMKGPNYFKPDIARVLREAAGA
jgi:predicted HAD superfamily Cof-like phosphohydrolase